MGDGLRNNNYLHLLILSFIHLLISQLTMNKRQQYWRTNLKYLFIFLALWFLIGQVFPILAVDYLNQFKVAGFPLGFWFAFQGSLVLFVLLFFVYNFLMNRLEKKYEINE